MEGTFKGVKQKPPRRSLIDSTAISHWESGKRFPSEENSQKLEKIFEEPISELMKEDPDYEPRYLIEQTKKRI